MRVERDRDGNTWLRDLTLLVADTAMRIPVLLESEDPRVRGRLLPEAYDDPEEERHWRRLGAPELERLFLSRAQLIRRDLETLARDGPQTFTLRIAVGHEAAWLSGLNGARLALFALHGLEASDMEREPETAGDTEKELALLRIHLMAYLQELLMSGEDEAH